MTEQVNTDDFSYATPSGAATDTQPSVGADSIAEQVHRYSATAGSGQAHLRLLATSDLHAHIYPYDYYADRASHTVGLARTAAHINALRAEAANSLLFDNGDFLQGSPLGDFAVREYGAQSLNDHPIIAAMNQLGYDAGTLGNHEFNYGLPFLQAACSQARFPLVCANLARGAVADTPLSDDRFGPPFIMLDRQVRVGDGQRRNLKLGVIGFLPPQVTIWDAHHLSGRAETRDVIETARFFIPLMKQQGADLIIALAHTGIDPTRSGEKMQENAAIDLAQIEGIDILITGHQHLRLPGPDFANIADVDAASGRINGKPAVMPGYWGSDLGVIDLLLDFGETGWRIAESECALLPISKRGSSGPEPLVGSAPDIVDTIRVAHEAALEFVRRPVGLVGAPLHTYFALLGNCAAVQLINRAQSCYGAQLAQKAGFGDLPLLSASAPFKTGGRAGPDNYTDISAGPLAIRNVADMYIYPNILQIVQITGEELRLWLEMSASIFHQMESGTVRPLIKPAAASYNFDVISGIEYQIDLTQPPRYDLSGRVMDPQAQRIVNLCLNGRPLDPRQQLLVVTNSFRASGGGNFPVLGPDRVVLVSPDTNRDVLISYIRERQSLASDLQPNWSFATMRGQQILFDTGPGAAAHLPEIAALAPENLGLTAEGYLRLRLTLP